MIIRPTDSDPSRRISAPGTEAAPVQPALRRAPDGTAAPAAAAPASDRAELSSAARELFERMGAPAAAAPALSPERTRAVLARLAAGHYDRAEVMDQVARKLQAAITDTPAAG